MTTMCQGRGCQAPDWMKSALKLAGVYNILFGLWVLGWPGAWFEFLGKAQPSYPFLWQCIGTMVGVYGVGYLAASSAPLKHWPIVMVGFLGKTLVSVGFLFAVSRGDLPWQAGWVIIFNDLIR